MVNILFFDLYFKTKEMYGLNFAIHSYISTHDGINHMFNCGSATWLNVRDKLKVKIDTIDNKKVYTEVYDIITDELYHDPLIHDDVQSTYPRLIKYLDILLEVSLKNNTDSESSSELEC